MKNKNEKFKICVTNVTKVTRLIYRELSCNVSVTFVTFNILLTFGKIQSLQSLHYCYNKCYMITS